MKLLKLAIMTITLTIMAAGAGAAKDPNKIVVDGSTTVGPVAKAFAEYFMARHPEVNITVSESGSGNGAKGLVNAACDVATMSRPMKKEEVQAAKDAGVLAMEHIVAMDGIAMVVHPSNPQADITVEQISRIYTGGIKNWKELGGPDQPIVAISRDTNSGTYETFETLVMNKQKLAERVEYVGSNGAIRQRVMSTPAAIGYVGLAYTEGVKSLKVNSIEATAESVIDKSYPVSRPLYMYTNSSPKEGTPLYEFINLARTPDGKKIIEATGFVPVK